MHYVIVLYLVSSGSNFIKPKESSTKSTIDKPKSILKSTAIVNEDNLESNSNKTFRFEDASDLMMADSDDDWRKARAEEVANEKKRIQFDLKKEAQKISQMEQVIDLF